MRYKTKDGSEQFIPGIGQTKNGIIVTDETIENPNFELIEEQPTPQQQAQPRPAVPQVDPQQQTNPQGVN